VQRKTDRTPYKACGLFSSLRKNDLSTVGYRRDHSAGTFGGSHLGWDVWAWIQI